MRALLTLLFLCTSYIVFAQEFHYPKYSSAPQSLVSILGRNWKIKDSTSGDLNGDHLRDVVLILQYRDSIIMHKDEDLSISMVPKILLILFRNKDGLFKPVLQNNTLISGDVIGESGDAIIDLNINKGIFTIDFDMIHSYAEYSCRYINNTFYLLRAHTSEHSGDTYSVFDIDFTTGHALSENGHPDSEKSNVKRYKIPAKPTIRFDSIKELFSIEVVKDKYI